MSYSRWSTSCWYIFSDATLVNDEPTLNVQCKDRYSLSELRENKEGILEKYRTVRFDRNPLNYHGKGPAPKDRYTQDEILELKEIIECFIEEH